MIITIFIIFLFVFLPGIIVHSNSLFLLRKNNEKELFWQIFNPLISITILVIGAPVLSFSFYTLLFSSTEERVTTLSYLSNETKDKYEKVLYSSLANLFGIKID